MTPRYCILWAQAIVFLAFASCQNHLSRVGKPAELSVEITPERVQRGAYLANHVAVCMDCHSRRNYNQFAGPIIAGSEGAGGTRFDHKMGIPGVFYGKNLTPAALHNWTDGELYRAITSGVSKEGKALLPVMPYLNYGKMASEDIKSIIAYLRSLPSIPNDVPDSKPDFWLKPLLKKMPQKALSQPKPALQDSIGYGKYLATFAGCADCHTPRRMGMPLKNKGFAGGTPFKLPSGTVTSANITPDTHTGIGRWTKADFIARFRAFDSRRFKPFDTQGGFNTPMPWLLYSGMTDEDLGAIYSYIQSLPPIKNEIVVFKPNKNASTDLASLIAGSYEVKELQVFDKKINITEGFSGTIILSKISNTSIKIDIDIHHQDAEATPVSSICDLDLVSAKHKMSLIEVTTKDEIGYVSKGKICLLSQDSKGAKTKIVAYMKGK